jgi:DNA-directed RNA polymerase specialized sigma24 family protein
MRTGKVMFDDDGRRVAAVEPGLVADEKPDAKADDDARLRRETLTRLLLFLNDGPASAITAGRRVVLLAAVLNRTSCSILGDQLGVSRQRAHCLLTRMRQKLSEMMLK